MKGRPEKAELRIEGPKHKPVVILLRKAHWGSSVRQLVDKATFIIDRLKGPNNLTIDPQDELTLTMIDVETGRRTEMFNGFVYRSTTNFEKDGNTGKIIKNDVLVSARSFPSVLTRNTIEGIFTFKRGFGEIVKEYAEKFGFNTTHVKLIPRQGTAFFTRIPVLEALRRMAYMQRWRLYFEGKKIFFEPWKPAPHSGVTLTDEDMIKGSLIEE